MKKLEEQRQKAELEKQQKLLAQQKEFKEQSQKTFNSQVSEFNNELELFSTSQQPKNLNKAQSIFKTMIISISSLEIVRRRQFITRNPKKPFDSSLKIVL